MTLLMQFYLHWLRVWMTCWNHRVTATLELLPKPYTLHIYLSVELTHPNPLIPKQTYMHDGFARRVSWICSQGSSEFTSQLLRRGDGTPASILNKVIFIWRLNQGCSIYPSSSVLIQNNGYGFMEAPAKKKHRAQLLMHSLWDMTRLSCEVPVYLKIQVPSPCLAVIDLPRHKMLAAFDFLSRSTPALLQHLVLS